MSSDIIGRIKTFQPGVTDGYIKSSRALSICPKSLDVVVPVMFWLDNLDQNFESLSVTGSICNTPGVMWCRG